MPGTLVYTLRTPYEQDVPHVVNVTFSIVGGHEDGTLGIIFSNSTVCRALC
jgi:hypothetical protein